MDEDDETLVWCIGDALSGKITAAAKAEWLAIVWDKLLGQGWDVGYARVVVGVLADTVNSKD